MSDTLTNVKGGEFLIKDIAARDIFSLEELNEEQKMLRDSIKEFIDKEVVPNRERFEHKDYALTEEVMRKLGEMGVLGIAVPEEYGGLGMDFTTTMLACDMASGANGSVATAYGAHTGIGTLPILLYGTEEQKKKYLPKLATAEWIGAWGLTETGTGSDAGGMHTTAVKDGDYYVINGSKNFITHAITGNVAVVIVRTGNKGDSHGMSAFIIEKGTPGFKSGKKENKLGMRASETAELIFDNCRVHKDQMLGKEGEGFIQAMKVLDGGRISIAALSVGIAKGAYESAIKYSKEREQFGKPISQFQAIGFKLADMATEIEAAELLTFLAADRKNKGLKMTKEGAFAKYYASEVAVRVSNDAVQIFGGYGYTKDFPAEKYYRDSKLCTIGEGTSEIQKLVISREILK